MSGDILPHEPHKDVLSTAEIDVLQALQVAHGARAKQAAAHLAEVLGLSDRVRLEFAGAVGARIEEAGLDFEERQAVADSLNDVATTLGAEAVDATVSAPALDLVRIEAEIRSIQFGDPEAAGDASHDQTLTPTQRSWFEKIFSDDDLIIIEQMSTATRLRLVAAMAAVYTAPEPPKVGRPENKTLKLRQIDLIMQGKDLAEIAKLSGVNLSALKQGLVIAATNIKEKAGEEGLQAILQMCLEQADEDTPASVAAAETREVFELTKEMATFYGKLFEGKEETKADAYAHELVRHFNLERHAKLAEWLAAKLRSVLLKSQGVVRTDRRCAELVSLLAGKTYEEISSEVGLPLPNVKEEIHIVANILVNKISKAELQEAVEAIEVGIEAE